MHLDGPIQHLQHFDRSCEQQHERKRHAWPPGSSVIILRSMSESVSENASQEVASARQVFRELDKSCRATRTYGLTNAVKRRFFDQLQTFMLAHLESWPVLAVIVERAELRLNDEVVYKGEDSLGESLAFRLYGDGVREVRFEQGVSPDDLQSFLDALWGRSGEDEDDDVVTRLWAKDLATISFVTAEDIIQAPSTEELTPQENGFFAAPPASFDRVLERERRLALVSSAASGEGPAAAGENLNRGGSGLVGFELTDRLIAQRVIDSLNLPDRAALIEKGLGTEAGRSMSGLSGIFAHLRAPAVGPLCGVLSAVTDEEHRAALRDTLIRLGAENPEPVLKGLADPRSQYVRDLVTIIVAWQRPQAKDELAMLAAHPAAEVREDALSSIARLHPNGDAAPVIAFASDAAAEVRQHAMRLLASSRYTATWEQWKPHLKEDLIELSRADKRILFLALRASAGNETVPFFLELISGRGWKQRQKREETALLAIKALATLGT